ncbi:MAG: nuclear transport factor 2 family protein [Anaerolineales bacterium]|nr:nuclear transport factor 2 family protein [Chloroflexota bacterium]MBL6982178.1 nuclear transport factor 2 family protein [Anaerolineales bacterium]
MNEKLLYIFLCLLVLLSSGCTAKPEDVMYKLAEFTNTKDLEAALELFDNEAVVTSVSPEPFSGKAEIQTWLEGMFADNFHLETEIAEVNGNVVIGNDTMSMDSMKFYGIDTMTGISEITVVGGKITTLNFSWSEETLIDLQGAPFVAREDLIGIWTVGTYMQINEDGTLRVAGKTADLDLPVSEDHPGSFEEWSYDGMVMTMRAIEAIGEGTSCTPVQVGVYFVRWAGDDQDRLKFEPIDDPCGSRYGGMQWGNWKSISP